VIAAAAARQQHVLSRSGAAGRADGSGGAGASVAAGAAAVPVDLAGSVGPADGACPEARRQAAAAVMGSTGGASCGVDGACSKGRAGGAGGAGGMALEGSGAGPSLSSDRRQWQSSPACPPLSHGAHAGEELPQRPTVAAAVSRLLEPGPPNAASAGAGPGQLVGGPAGCVGSAAGPGSAASQLPRPAPPGFWPRTIPAMSSAALPVGRVPFEALRAVLPGVAVGSKGAPISVPVRLEVDGTLRPGSHMVRFYMQPDLAQAQGGSWPEEASREGEGGGMAAGTVLVGWRARPDLPGTLVAVYASGERLELAKLEAPRPGQRLGTSLAGGPAALGGQLPQGGPPPPYTAHRTPAEHEAQSEAPG
jgi:hypothetical protein